MQRYCHPVKAINVGGSLYRTPSPAAKTAAWFVVSSLTRGIYDTIHGLRGDAYIAGRNAIEARRKVLEKKAYRRILPIMKKYFTEPL